MRHFLLKTMVSSFAVLVASFLLHGVSVRNTFTAVLVAVVMGVLNNFVKPILVFLTIPITVFTFGIFLLFINVVIVKWTSDIVPGFHVSGWVSALMFSFIVSLVTSMIQALVREDR